MGVLCLATANNHAEHHAKICKGLSPLWAPLHDRVDVQGSCCDLLFRTCLCVYGLRIESITGASWHSIDGGTHPGCGDWWVLYRTALPKSIRLGRCVNFRECKLNRVVTFENRAEVAHRVYSMVNDCCWLVLVSNAILQYCTMRCWYHKPELDLRNCKHHGRSYRCLSCPAPMVDSRPGRFSHKSTWLVSGRCGVVENERYSKNKNRDFDIRWRLKSWAMQNGHHHICKER